MVQKQSLFCCDIKEKSIISIGFTLCILILEAIFLFFMESRFYVPFRMYIEAIAMPFVLGGDVDIL